MWDNSQVPWFPVNKGNIDLYFTYKPFAHSYQLFSFPVINTTKSCPSRLYFYKYIKHIYIWKLLLSHFVMRQLASFKATICSLEFCQFIACSYGLSHLHFVIIYICNSMLMKMWNTLLNLIFQYKESKPRHLIRISKVASVNQIITKLIQQKWRCFIHSNHHKINSAKVEIFHCISRFFSWEYS